jgi:hypothetical protein
MNSYNDEDIRIERDNSGSEIYIFDPYNPLNIEIKESDVEKILENYGINIHINNFNLYKRAFIHRSYIRRPNIENSQNNITIVPKPENCL